MRREAWIDSHAWLKPMARFCAEVEAAADALVKGRATAPSWEEHRGEFLSGVPLLQSASAAIDLKPAAESVVAVVNRLAAAGTSSKPGADLRVLAGELRRESDANRIAGWLLGEPGFTPTSPGLLRYVGWTATSRWLENVVAEFAAWCDEDRWLRPTCPTCGAPPAMAQLLGEDPGRKRHLVCGACRTRWRFGRTACPFCEADTHRIAVLAVEGEAGLRIDYCESCRGYLKTYDGRADEALLLADWTSLHLDALALERGLVRKAASLFELGAAAPAGS